MKYSLSIHLSSRYTRLAPESFFGNVDPSVQISMSVFLGQL